MFKIKFFYNSLLLVVLVNLCGTFSVYAQKETLNKFIQKNGLDKISSLEEWAYTDLFYRSTNEKIKLLNELELMALEKNDKITLRTIKFYRNFFITVIDLKNQENGLNNMLAVIKETEENSDLLQAAYFKHVIGYFYFTSKTNYILALQNMLQAHYEFKKHGYQNIYDSSGMLDRLGYLYYHLNNYNESVKYFKLSLIYIDKNTRKHIGVLNSVGQSYREIYEMDSALVYFKKSRTLAIKTKDTAWIGINSGNIGNLYLNTRKVDLSYPYIIESYEYAKKTNDQALISEALTNLGNISLLKGNLKNATNYLKMAEEFLFKPNDTINLSFENYIRKQNFYAIYSNVYKENGDNKTALKYLKFANTIRDSIEKRAALSKNISINYQFEADQNNNILHNLEQEKKSAVFKKNIFIVIGLLLFVISILMFGHFKNDKKIQLQKRQLLNLEKNRIQIDLNIAKTELNDYLENLRKKTEVLELVESELNILKESNRTEEKQNVDILQKLNQAKILTEEDWLKFKNLFEKVYDGFFTRLKITYPNLTPAEIRLCALIKLNMHSNDMATMMGISTMGIKKNKQRLRKKIILNENEKLEDLFINF